MSIPTKTKLNGQSFLGRYMELHGKDTVYTCYSEKSRNEINDACHALMDINNLKEKDLI